MQKKFFFIAYLAFSIHCLAQQYPFVHYSPKDGLVNSRVRKAWQDSKGRMYFMTFGGLSIYDGARFTNYTVQDGLASDLVNDVLEMGEDSFWIACNISALNYLSRGTIKTLKTADGTAPTINKFIRTSNGTIYVVADEGLFLHKENRFARLPFENSHGVDVGKFLIEGVKWKDFIIILTDNSLSHLGPGNLYVFNTITNRLIAEDETKYITTACVGNDNSIYVSDGKGTLNLLDTAALLKGNIQFIPPPARYHAVQTGIAYLHFDNNNNLWLYTSSRKVLKVDPAGFVKEFSVETGLSSNSFSGIFNDKEGTAWITMDGSGVDKLVSDYIQRYDKFGNLPVSNMYTSALTDSVYLYSWPEKKMIVVDNNGATVYEFTGTPVFPNASCVLNGNVYLADGISLFRLNLHQQKKKIETTLLYKDTGEATFGNFLADPYGNLILAGTSYITALKNFKPVYFYAVKDYIDQMTIDNRNRLWVASRAGELLVFEINPGGNKNYLQLLKSYSEIPDLSARSLTADKSGNIWIGTRSNGLYCLDLDSGLVIHSTRHYTTREGLSDNFVINLTCDPENNIWISTSSGLDRISRMGNSFRIENITRSNNIYDHVLKTLVSKNGVAWSTTVDGKLIRIGKAPVNPAYTPSLLITSLRPGNNGAPGLPESNSFSYRQNSFSVSAAAPSFYDEQQIKYSYLLKGSNNNQWSEPANTADFNFINLNPGKYTLRIKASFPAGRYPDQVIDYAFLIRPPWWQTWWFRIIAGLIVVGLLIIIVRYYYQNKLREQKAFSEKQQAVEKERTRIATDIHDDLGSGLSRIRYLGEMVKLKTSQQQNILPDIEKIAVFSDEMVDKMNEIVWALNEKNDSLDAIISYIRSFAVEYLSNNNIECKVTLPERVPIQNVKGETRRNIFLSVKECLHNTVKHAGATLVTIDISANGWLIISLHDNGRGIDWDNRRPFSNGIQNIKKRMREAGGTTDFRNDAGTTVVLAIPL